MTTPPPYRFVRGGQPQRLGNVLVEALAIVPDPTARRRLQQSAKQASGSSRSRRRRSA